MTDGEGGQGPGAGARAPSCPGGSPEGRELPTGSEAVLLVEDDAFVRLAGQRMLERLGYRVWAAPDGPAALALLASGACEPDLLFSDVVMPGMNGLELAAEVRARRPGIRVLLTSGYTEELVQREDGGPPLAFLAKPYTPQVLARALREVLDARLT